ncbi:hypothetical protein [Hymenobacter ruricola]|uniref:Uncharacterized protein n=1 Tax=Hymenobacter ruricola TaxID=2791023 RepID=A0ABS0I2V7_9BACT|nr:hypothetical protein [Hymenobacter ruricola]MBF9221275.1 hypothetical protein [Hymenobacter ruricola]
METGLSQLAAHLARLGFGPTYRGDPYGQGLDWLYFDCFFDEAAVRRRFSLGPGVRYVAYDGRVAGQEAGFYDPTTGFGVMGHHPDYGRAARKPEITGAE